MFQYDIFFSLCQTRWLSDIFGVFSFILGSDGWCTIGVANCSRRYLTYCGSAPLQSLHPWAQNQQFSRFCCSYPFEALLKNTSFLTAHFSWTLNIGFNCQPVRLPLYNHGGLPTSLFLLNSLNLERSNFFLICLQFSCQIMIVNLFQSLETPSHHHGKIISSAKAGPSYLLWYMIVDGCDLTDPSVTLALTKPL